ncbi:MAG: methylenetetrahydrofolate reductase C-terminal domain-containing protein [bacterium]
MSGYPNHLLEALRQRRFALTIELTTPPAGAPAAALHSMLGLAHGIREEPRVAAIALTDRSSADRDLGAIDTGRQVADVSGKAPLIHWAGKDRSAADFEADLRRAAALGLENFLLITGDKVRHPPPDRPVRYLDSVNALHAARGLVPSALLAAAVCPFKYREEDLLGQYFKAAKKLRAGADLLMTQIGWDMAKFEELGTFLAARGYDVPLIAEFLYLTAPRARRLHRQRLAGVTITDDLMRLLEEEERTPDRGRAAAYRRLALQIIGVRHLGYAGAQVSGLPAHAGVVILLETVETCARECPTPEAWREAWRDALTGAGGGVASVAPADGFYFSEDRPNGGVTASSAERAAFGAMDWVHRAAFAERTIGARLLGGALRRLDGRSGVGGALLAVERATKGPLVGCATCGFCRLPETAYVCPETCPKGLANGPCGGTQENRCEFGDRECIHARIYRITKGRGRLNDLEDVLIPPVPESAWGSCSWVTHFQEKGPKTIRLVGAPGSGRPV